MDNTAICTRGVRSRARIALGALALVVLGGCEPAPKARLLDFRELGELRVATRQDTLSYRIGPDGNPGGFEHDLLEALGERLGVPVRFTVMPTSASALRAIEHGNVHLAAAGLIHNDAVSAAWTSPVREVDYVLVGRNDGPTADDESDLAGHRIGVRPGSVPAQRLQSLRRRVPTVRLAFARFGGEAELLERVAEGELEFAAADRSSFQVVSKYRPDLRIVMPLDLRAQIAWAVTPDARESLLPEVEAFLADARESGLIARIAERYFGHVRRLGDGHVKAFLERLKSRLPRYRAAFVEAGRRYGLDWRLVAAVAYQESQWDPSATSPTGVRGMMMLTEETAARLGVTNRLDAQQSILGGARYLATLRDELPPEVAEPDRSWMAVAAYNLGMGHLRGAGAIARSLSRDDTSWMDMKRVLPLISRPAYAARLQSGAGRGGEAVIMTESVRNYYEILARFEPAESAADTASGRAAADQGTNTSTPPM